jgi:probable rRNA maturation factor
LSENHGLERELEILVIHGFLHLLGFKHRKGIEAEEKKTRTLMLD